MSIYRLQRKRDHTEAKELLSKDGEFIDVIRKLLRQHNT